jgi:hypothetical protein
LTIKLNSWLTEPFKLNVILSKDNKISDMSCYILVQSCDWTESENVNCLKISDENEFLCNHDNWFFYKICLQYKGVFDCEDLMTKCLLFTVKLFVFKYCFIFIVLVVDTSSLGSTAAQNRGSKPSVKGRSLLLCSVQWGN